MKNKYFIPLLLLFAIVSTYMSCDKKEDEKCLSYQISPVLSINGPSNGVVNQDIPVTVTYNISNGCGSFDSFDLIPDNDTLIIKPKIKYEGCICTQIFITAETNYIFRTMQPGTYYFKYFQDNQTFIYDTIAVQ